MNEMKTLHISWEMHGNAMSLNLKKLFSEHIFTDVSVACEGKLYPAHKFVLSTYSEYFEEIFSSTQGSNMVVVLKDVSKKNFEYVLEYMYLGEVDVSQEDFGNFLKTSEFLKMKSLPMLYEEGREPSVLNDFEGREASLVQKKRKLYKKNQSSVEIRDSTSIRSDSSTHNSPTPGTSMQSEVTHCHPALPLQQSIQTYRAHRLLAPEDRLFPGNVTTTMISENAQPAVFPGTHSPATKQHPLVTIPTTPTYICFSSPSQSPINIKEEIDPHCFLELCTEEEDMDQLDFGTENEGPDLYSPSQNNFERDQFINRRLIDKNQEDIVASRSSTKISEEGTRNRTSKEATESKASRKARKDRTTKHGSKKGKWSKSILDDTTKNLIKPCHVLLEQLAVVEENGILRWRNPSQNLFKRSSHSTQSRPQRGKENSGQERSGAPLSKRTLATSNRFTKLKREIENCNAMAVEETDVANIVTGPNEKLDVIYTEASDTGFQQELISEVTDPSGAETFDVFCEIGYNLSNTACIGNNSPPIQIVPCNSCNLTFLEANTRDMHEQVHQGKHICLYCNQTFKASYMQRTHMILHDSHVAPLHTYLKKTCKLKKWYFVFLHMGHPCVQLKPNSRPVVIRTTFELEKLMSLLQH
ncbi:uncharacterized protein LOC143018101 [Oratosquilla oratoria]|uniref:uncharacterized protein LOC143018101 n=1 Tax=Oratosquilla oratoria TaxID=337810 RepID=UPI003F77482C